MRHGKGKFENSKGEVYEANWKYDRINGRGIYTNKLGEKTEVVWYNDVMVPLPK